MRPILFFIISYLTSKYQNNQFRSKSSHSLWEQIHIPSQQTQLLHRSIFSWPLTHSNGPQNILLLSSNLSPAALQIPLLQSTNIHAFGVHIGFPPQSADNTTWNATEKIIARVHFDIILYKNLNQSRRS